MPRRIYGKPKGMTRGIAKRAIERVVTSPRTWVICTLLAISTAAGVAANHAAADRGLLPESLWLLEASEQRVAFYEAWRTGATEPSAHDKPFITKTFRPQSALPPLMPAIVATVKAKAPKASTAHIATTVNAVCFALFVLLLGLMGLEAGGAFGAITAAIGAASVPRIFGIASIVGFGMSALLVWTLTIYLMHRARRGLLAALTAPLAVAASLHVGVFGFFVWIPWLYVTLTAPRVPPRDDGRVVTPALPLRNVAIVPVGLALGFWSYPWLWVDTKDHLHKWLTHFLRQGADPFSYGGQLWGVERLPWHAAPFLLLATVPPTLVLLALVGIRFGDRYAALAKMRWLRWLQYLPFHPERPARQAALHHLVPRSPGRAELIRLAYVCMLITLTLPLLVRSPSFGGLDLIALAVPWVLVCAAAGMQRMMNKLLDIVPWRAVAARRAREKQGPSTPVALAHALVGTAFACILLGPPVFELVRYHPFEEAYYSWLVGGPEGARARGLPRYPKGPLPMSVLREVVEERGGKRLSVGFLLPNSGRLRTLHRALRDHIAPPGLVIRDSVYNADVAILEHDDLEPGYEDALTDFYRTVIHDTSYALYVYQRGSVPLISIAIAGK